MNELALNGEKSMTVKEVAQAFNCAENTIHKRVKDLFPEIIQNGKTTYLNEAQVTQLKLELNQNAHLLSEYKLPMTNLEKQLLIKQASMLQDEIIAELQSALDKSEKRIDRLVHNNRTYTTTEIAKELNFKSAQAFNKKLQDEGIIYKDTRNVWLLRSEYSNKGLQNIKQKEDENGNIHYYSEWTGLGRDFLVGALNVRIGE